MRRRDDRHSHKIKVQYGDTLFLFLKKTMESYKKDIIYNVFSHLRNECLCSENSDG